VIVVTYEEVHAESAMGERRFKGMRVMLGDRELARGHNPMGDACRLLIAEGHSRTEEVQAYWRGSPKPVWKRGTQLRQFVGFGAGREQQGVNVQPRAVFKVCGERRCHAEASFPGAGKPK
jgi:hypothetical protein